MNSASLVIEKQESLAQDKFSKNGVLKELHIVAKNIPWTLYVSAPSDVNFHEFPLTAKLIYDSEIEEKEVETLKQSPLEYTCHVDVTGSTAAVEIRIGVLSSQHEGAYFRVKLDTQTSDTVYTVYSHPFRVVSKRNQVKKLLAKTEEVKQALESPAAQPTTPPSAPSKRSHTEMISETLVRLEQQQREQNALMQQLLKNSTSPSIVAKSSDQQDFDTAFQNFLSAYRKLSNDERPNKLRKVMTGISTSEKSVITDLITSVETKVSQASTGLDEVDLNSLLFNAGSSDCSASCPYKKQLERLDIFYSEFLSDPISSPISGDGY